MFRPRPNAASGPSRNDQPASQDALSPSTVGDVAGSGDVTTSLPTGGDEGFISRMMADK
jgi:hypothetical protein